MKKLFTILLLCSFFAFGQKKIKVACVGDSVTFGMLLENPDKESYPAVLADHLGSQYEVGNFGKSGATLLKQGHRPYIQQQEYKKALDFKADWVVIHLGLNDTDPRNWNNYKDHFIKDYLSLMEDFKRVNPNTKFWICRMSPITHKHTRFLSGTRLWHNEIQKEIEKIAQLSGAQLIDLEAVLFNYPHLLPDSIHPNKQGASLIAQRVYQALTGDFGGLHLPEIYSDNMVLKRNSEVKISGIANFNDEVLVSIEKKEGKKTQKIFQKLVQTPANGRWEVIFHSPKEGEGYLLDISTKNKKINLKNIAFGEVFLCSGQSNMAWRLSQSHLYDKNQDFSVKNIRIFNQKPIADTDSKAWSADILEKTNNLKYFNPTSWELLNATNAPEFSAVAYYFGKMLSENLKEVPIGLIHNAIGGSNLESWIDRETLEEEYPLILPNWRKSDFLMDWVRQRAGENLKEAKTEDQRHPYEPAYLFESGVLPLKNYPISGIIWYQGESNTHNIEVFEDLFPLFVKSWRNHFNNPTLPLYFVQLSSIERPSWGWFRHSQQQLEKKIPHTYMAVSFDIGHKTDVHPKNKKEVGERLARLCLHHQFQQNITPKGPSLKQIEFKEEAVYAYFNNAESLKPTTGNDIIGFEVANTKGLYFPAKVKILNHQTLKIYHPEVKSPKVVRYAFSPFTEANLVNQENLPCSTFFEEVK